MMQYLYLIQKKDSTIAPPKKEDPKKEPDLPEQKNKSMLGNLPELPKKSQLSSLAGLPSLSTPNKPPVASVQIDSNIYEDDFEAGHTDEEIDEIEFSDDGLSFGSEKHPKELF
jgi:hypothetical protein